MFAACQGEVADNMQTMAATCCPTRDYTNHNLGHETNESLYFKNVQATCATSVDGVLCVAIGVLVSVFAANSLVSATAKCPTTIFGRWTIAG
jgi:hypothetical protein